MRTLYQGESIIERLRGISYGAEMATPYVPSGQGDLFTVAKSLGQTYCKIMSGYRQERHRPGRSASGAGGHGAPPRAMPLIG